MLQKFRANFFYKRCNPVLNLELLTIVPIFSICNSQSLTLIKITTHVPLRQNRYKAINELDMPVGPTRTQWGSLRSYPESTIIPSYLQESMIIRSLPGTATSQDHPPWMLNSGEAVSQVGGSNLPDEDPSRRLSLLHRLQLSGTIPVIRGVHYVARSSPCSKHYNAPTSMRTVMNSGGYLFMAIP